MKPIVAAACLLFAGSALAEGAWTFSTWSSFTAATDDLLVPSYLASASDEWLCNDTVNEGKYFSGSKTMTWTFPVPATLNVFRFYVQWKDTGCDQVNVAAIRVKVSGSDEWSTIVGSSGHSGNTDVLKLKVLGVFADSDGAPLAEHVTAVCIDFGAQEAGYGTYDEIEVLL